MSYAPADRDYYDADSHIMELPNFLTSYADPKIRDQIPEVSYSASLVTDEENAMLFIASAAKAKKTVIFYFNQCSARNPKSCTE